MAVTAVLAASAEVDYRVKTGQLQVHRVVTAVSAAMVAPVVMVVPVAGCSAPAVTAESVEPAAAAVMVDKALPVRLAPSPALTAETVDQVATALTAAQQATVATPDKGGSCCSGTTQERTAQVESVAAAATREPLARAARVQPATPPARTVATVATAATPAKQARVVSVAASEPEATVATAAQPAPSVWLSPAHQVTAAMVVLVPKAALSRVPAVRAVPVATAGHKATVVPAASVVAAAPGALVAWVGLVEQADQCSATAALVARAELAAIRRR
jgi:hypothetical protein